VLLKLLPYILFENYIYILALEMASPYCANCISTLSFHMYTTRKKIVLRDARVCAVHTTTGRVQIGAQSVDGP